MAEEDVWDYNAQGNKVIRYPKLTIRLALELPVAIVGFIKVIQIVDNIPEVLGRTDTCQKSNTPNWYRSPISFTFYCGVDNHMKLKLEIYDGDYLSIGEGYLLETVDLLVVETMRPNAHLPIIIEKDNWGTVFVSTEFDFENSFTEVEISVDRLQAGALGLRFFSEEPPTFEQVYEQISKSGTKQFHVDKFFDMSFSFVDFNPYPLAKVLLTTQQMRIRPLN